MYIMQMGTSQATRTCRSISSVACSASACLYSGADTEGGNMAMLGLGHVGIYVHDLENMVAFYRNTLGLRITKQNWRGVATRVSTILI